MLNWKAVLIFLCIFLAGGVTGAFVSMRIACNKDQKKPEPTAQQVQNQPRRPIEEWSTRTQKAFAEKVEITPEQKAQLDPLIQSTQAEFRGLREQSFQMMADITEKLDAQVMTLLTPEQKPKYEQMIKERQERFKKKEAERAAAAARGDHPPGPPPPEGKPSTPPPSGDKQVPPPTTPSTGTPSTASSETPATPTPKVP
jgi:Spy/CpxP family protein refolding chaperone